MRRRTVFWLLPLFFAASCGSSNLTGPSDTIPNVAGNYSGTAVLVYPELTAADTVNCTATTAVTQSSGGRINVAPMQLKCPGGNTSFPLGDTTINATGSLGSSTGVYENSCGHYDWVGSGGFFGRSMQLSFSYTSKVCYNMIVTINVTR